jgi:amidohydrolase
MAAADGFEVRLIGRGGHAASPHRNRDPVPAAAQSVLALQTVVSRHTKPTEPVVLSVCVIEGGTAFNVIPEEVRLAGTVRTVTAAHRRTVPRLMKRILSGVARSAGVKVELRYNFYYPLTANHGKSVEFVAETVRQITGRQRAYRQAQVRMGAEDFSYYLDKVPGAFAFLGTRGRAARTQMNHHNPYFDIDERALPLGTALLAALALTQE